MRQRWISTPNQPRTERVLGHPCPALARGRDLGTGCGGDSRATQRHRHSGLSGVTAELRPGAFAATSTSCCSSAPSQPKSRDSAAARQPCGRLPAGSPGSPDPPCGDPAERPRPPPHRGAPRPTLPRLRLAPKTFGEVGGDGGASQRCPWGRAAAARPSPPKPACAAAREGSGPASPAPTCEARRWRGGAAAGGTEPTGGASGERRARRLPWRGARAAQHPPAASAGRTVGPRPPFKGAGAGRTGGPPREEVARGERRRCSRGEGAVVRGGECCGASAPLLVGPRQPLYGFRKG